MTGEESVYAAKDEGNVKNCPSKKELHIKEQSPVMLIANFSDELVSGLSGKVVGHTENSMTVFFPSLKQEVVIERFAFTKYSAALKKDVGCRLQFPLKLEHAIKIHKAQGMTMDRVSLDCKNMFQYGQLAVGLSRARFKKGLQVLNFSKSLVKQPPVFISEFFQKEPLTLHENLSCCRNNTEFDLFHIKQTTECSVSYSVYNEDFDSDIEQEIIEAVESIEQNLTEDNPQFKYPLPPEFAQKTLQNLFYNNPETDQQNSENCALTFMKEHTLETDNYIQLIWEKFHTMVDNYVMCEQNITNRTLTLFYKECNKFITSEENKLKVRHLFGHNPTKDEYNVVYRLMSASRKEVLNIHSQPIRKEAKE